MEKVGHSKFQMIQISGGKVMEETKNLTILALYNSLCKYIEIIH